MVTHSVDDSLITAECINSPTPSHTEGLPSSLVAHGLGNPDSEKDNRGGNNLNGYSPSHLNIPMKISQPNCEYETKQDNVPLQPQPHQQGTVLNNRGSTGGAKEAPGSAPEGHPHRSGTIPAVTVHFLSPPPPGAYSPPTQGPIAEWIATQREEIVAQMTEACLNQSLDALLARSMLMREDYELVKNQQTRTAKVRQLLDNCHRHNEDFCRIVVRKLHDNKQMNLKPYPAEIASPTSGPPMSLSCNISRNV